MLLSFLPIIGPILTPIIGAFNNYFNNKTQVLKTETQGSVEIIKATEEDWGVRLARDVVLWPWSLWMGLIGWDTVVATHWKWLQWGVPNPPDSVAYIPYAVMIFLLGNIGINMWNRK